VAHQRKEAEQQIDKLIKKLDVQGNFSVKRMICTPNLGEMCLGVDSSEECAVQPPPPLTDELRDSIYR
jgi:hypothetical protein